MKKSNLKNLTLIALFAALLCASAIIYIPLVVPITLQTLVICLCCELLGTKKAMVVYLVYIAIGFLGLPVFSGFNGGITALFSNTGGFIVGFLAFILVKGLTKKLFKKGYVSSIVSSALGLVALYFIGSVWFTFIYFGEFSLPLYLSSLALSVLPFILPDVLKIIVAGIIAKRIKKFF
jgi:biotin transport system substrate-specific component